MNPLVMGLLGAAGAFLIAFTEFATDYIRKEAPSRRLALWAVKTCTEAILAFGGTIVLLTLLVGPSDSINPFLAVYMGASISLFVRFITRPYVSGLLRDAINTSDTGSHGQGEVARTTDSLSVFLRHEDGHDEKERD